MSSSPTPVEEALAADPSYNLWTDPNFVIDTNVSDNIGLLMRPLEARDLVRGSRRRLLFTDGRLPTSEETETMKAYWKDVIAEMHRRLFRTCR